MNRLKQIIDWEKERYTKDMTNPKEILLTEIMIELIFEVGGIKRGKVFRYIEKRNTSLFLYLYCWEVSITRVDFINSHYGVQE